MAITIVTKMDDRLDHICFDYYGSTATRQVEQVIEANPGLEAQPILLPVGLSITLPDLVISTTPVVKQIKLWS